MYVIWDLSGGPVVENPPCNAEDAGLDAASIPGQGTKIPHVAGQLSLHMATRKSVHHK